MIKRRKLGRTELSVSEIGLGGWQLGTPTKINDEPGMAFGGLGEKTALNIINTALELGINTFDTADVYSLGNSEYRLGKALKEFRSDVYIFTKAGNIPGIPGTTDMSYHYLMSAVDRSLARLQTDYVDLFQVHIPPQTEKDFVNVERAFREIKSEGKARYCGISIGVHYERGIEIIKRNFVDAIQLYFSLIDPKPLKELLPLAKKNKIGIIIAEPLAQGFLTNKYKPGHIFPKDDIRRHGYDPKLLQMKLKRSQQFKFLIKGNRTLNQAALSYILCREEISTCITGSKSVEQLRSNVAATQVKLSTAEFKKIEEIQQNWNEGISVTG
jgi:aryl-alcohol dehydrogenase-like predicted oxidoreductase